MRVVERRPAHTPTWMRIRWWRIGLIAFAILLGGGGGAFGLAVFPVLVTLGVAWILWRSDRDSGRS